MFDLTTEIKQLEQAREERAHSIIQIHLQMIVGRMPDMADRFQTVIDGSKTLKAASEPLRKILVEQLVTVSDDMLAVPEYVEKNKSKQDMLIFVGTHWRPMMHQVWHDFVKDCARMAGLTTEFLDDHNFMLELFANFAFALSHHREQYVPKGLVWVNLQNGTLEIQSDGAVRLREHESDDYFTYVLPYSYLPEAKCPLWHEFLDKVMPEKEMQMLLAEYIGYCFTKDLKLEKMAVFYGGGANGKSVATDVIAGILGECNVCHIDLEKLTTDENQRSQCEGKLANISQENSQGVSYSMLKTMVSGEPVMVKILYKDPRLMYNYGKIIASYNTLPRTENTVGFFRRWLLFPFNVTIKREEMDPRLKDKLLKEAPGILNWVLEGLVRLNVNRQFTVSRSCEDALEDYKISCNSALRFLAERCVEAEDGRISLSELFAEYNKFCCEDNVQKRFGKKQFAAQIESAGNHMFMIYNHKHYRLKIRSEM